MYNCKNCGKSVKFATRLEIMKAKRLKVKTKRPTSALKVVVEVRPKSYETIIIRKIKGRNKEIIIRSKGHEIVREWDVCKSCYRGLKENESKLTSNEEKPYRGY